MKLVQAYAFTNGTPRPIECENFAPCNKEKGFLNVYPIQRSKLIGFGGAFTDSSAYNYSLLSDEQKKEVLEDLFGENGLGYTLCRLCIGSSDFALEEYCYVEEGDDELKSFNIDRDKKYVIPFLKDALRYTGNKLRLFASPWSPPAFMKENGTRLHGGKLLVRYYETYAEYIVKFLMAYRAEGIDIWALTPQNEPKAKQTWESCFYGAEDEIAFTKILKKVLVKHGLDVKILGWDHNKERLFERADQLFSADTDLFDGVGFHWYSGAHYNAISAVKAKYPEKLVIATEFCKTLTSVVDYVSWRYANEILNDLACGADGICEWNLILDEDGGPYHDRISGCDAPIRVNADSRTARRSETYYDMYMFSHFIREGAVSLYTSSFDEKVQLTAAQNPNGDLVVVVFNKGEDCAAKLYINGEALDISLTAGGLYTFVIEQ